MLILRNFILFICRYLSCPEVNEIDSDSEKKEVSKHTIELKKYEIRKKSSNENPFGKAVKYEEKKDSPEKISYFRQRSSIQ